MNFLTNNTLQVIHKFISCLTEKIQMSSVSKTFVRYVEEHHRHSLCEFYKALNFNLW